MKNKAASSLFFIFVRISPLSPYIQPPAGLIELKNAASACLKNTSSDTILKSVCMECCCWKVVVSCWCQPGTRGGHACYNSAPIFILAQTSLRTVSRVAFRRTICPANACCFLQKTMTKWLSVRASAGRQEKTESGAADRTTLPDKHTFLDSKYLILSKSKASC